MVEVGSISVQAMLDGTKFKQGITGMLTSMDNVKKKSVELTGRMGELGGVLDGIGGVIKGLGLGLLGFVTSAVSMSPQLKEMFMNLKPILLDLANFIGPKLKPVFDAIVSGARSFSEGLKNIENRFHIIRAASELLSKGIKFAINVNEVTGGWAGLLAAGIAGAGAVSFIAGKIGLGAVSVGGVTSIAIPLALVIGSAITAGKVKESVQNLPGAVKGVVDAFNYLTGEGQNVGYEDISQEFGGGIRGAAMGGLYEYFKGVARPTAIAIRIVGDNGESSNEILATTG